MKRRVVVLFLAVCVLMVCGSCWCQKAGGSKWQSLFNGKDLDGWYVAVKDQGKVDLQDFFRVEDGVVHVYPDAPAGTVQPFAGLITEREYTNYHFSVEYKWGQKKFYEKPDAARNSGLLYHVIEPETIWPVCVECQMQQGNAGDIISIRSRLTSTVNPQTKEYLPASEGGQPVTVGDEKGFGRVVKGTSAETPDGWNRMEIIVVGDDSTHIVNGQIVSRVDNATYWDASSESWKPLTGGRILLQAEGAEMFLRNMKIQPLKADAVRP